MTTKVERCGTCDEPGEFFGPVGRWVHKNRSDGRGHDFVLTAEPSATSEFGPVDLSQETPDAIPWVPSPAPSPDTQRMSVEEAMEWIKSAVRQANDWKYSEAFGVIARLTTPATEEEDEKAFNEWWADPRGSEPTILRVTAKGAWLAALRYARKRGGR